MKNGQFIGEIPLESKNFYLARNDHFIKNLDYVLTWRGSISAKQQQNVTNSNITQQMVSTGMNYRIRVSVLKIFGNPKIVDDWEKWYSPSFQIIG
jgi:hypothetical protein